MNAVNPYRRLQAQRDAEADKVAALFVQVVSFLVHIDSAKFAGTDPDGSRRDWIATTDVRRRLCAMRDIINERSTS